MWEDCVIQLPVRHDWEYRPGISANKRSQNRRIWKKKSQRERSCQGLLLECVRVGVIERGLFCAGSTTRGWYCPWLVARVGDIRVSGNERAFSINTFNIITFILVAVFCSLRWWCLVFVDRPSRGRRSGALGLWFHRKFRILLANLRQRCQRLDLRLQPGVSLYWICVQFRILIVFK